VGKRNGGRAGAPRRLPISVVVPALNEAGSLPKVVESVCLEPIHELIVVDGGSTDGTPVLAQAAGATVLVARTGRARQMNIGAAAATGRILLFLHADTLVPPDYGELVLRILSMPGTAAGAFEFRFDRRFSGSKLLERLVNWRSRLLQMPYGDQCLFVRAEVFRQVGGFPNLPIMEDLELVRRLRRWGRIRIAQAPAVTSSRRWVNFGVWRTTVMNQICIGAYYAGVSPRAVARLYARTRGLRNARRHGALGAESSHRGPAKTPFGH
jgi:rSAM/selenodomain-associated transferase 2